MAEVAVLVHTHTALAERVAGWETKPAEPMVTWALCWVHAVPNAADLAAIRAAAKICDRVACVVGAMDALGTALPNLPAVLREAGCDIVWIAKPHAKSFVTVDCGVDGLNGTVLMQGICAVLPLLVVVQRTEIAMIRAMRNMLALMGDMFTLRIVD